MVVDGEGAVEVKDGLDGGAVRQVDLAGIAVKEVFENAEDEDLYTHAFSKISIP